jgi:hypothetical protein
MYINITLRRQSRQNAEKAKGLRERRLKRKGLERIKRYPRLKEIRQ